MTEEYHYLLKFVLIGDSCVGKSCFLSQYIGNSFIQEHEQTIGVEFESKVLELNDGILVQNQIWDTSGDVQYRGIQKTFCQKQIYPYEQYFSSAAALLFYKITDKKTFDSLKGWIDILRSVCSPIIQIVIIATHKDLEDQRQITSEEGKLFAKTIDARYYEISNHDKEAIDGIISFQSYNILRLIEQKKINPTKQIFGVKLSRQLEQEYQQLMFDQEHNPIQNQTQMSPKQSKLIKKIEENTAEQPEIEQKQEIQPKPKFQINIVILIVPIILAMLLSLYFI